MKLRNCAPSRFRLTGMLPAAGRPREVAVVAGPTTVFTTLLSTSSARVQQYAVSQYRIT